MRKSLLCLLIVPGICFPSVPSLAQLPEYYKDVHHAIWVVEDLSGVRRGWESIGFSDIKDLGTLTITENGTRMSTVKACCGHLGGARVLWIQAIKGKNAFTRFHGKYGDGVYSLVHEPGSTFEFEREITRWKSAGVSDIERIHVHGEQCDVLYAFAGTMQEGKYALGIVEEASSAYFDEQSGGSNALDLNFSQYAFAIQDPAPISDFWESLGFPEMQITTSQNHDKLYMGAPADYGMDLGWQRHGNIVYEWCIPTASPNVYEDHIKKHGEGFQHFGFRTADMDRALDFMKSRGLTVSQSGGWGEKGQPGSGRYAYIDATSFGGVSIELLWSYQ